MATTPRHAPRRDHFVVQSFPIAAIGVGLFSSLIWTTFLGYVLFSLAELLV